MIYDCFTFFNEMDILKLRLSLYDSYVDYFVICECCKTQTGETKEYNFEKKSNDFKKWKDKIIYLKANYPPPIDKKITDWAIEYYQRNFIIQGLKKCNPDDLIFISDIDEFWNPEILKNPQNFKIKHANQKKGKKIAFLQYKNIFQKNIKLLFSNDINNFLEYFPLAIQQDFFYYFMNYRKDEKWYGTIISKFKNIHSIQELRNHRQTMPYITPPHHHSYELTKKNISAGWHFSYLGGRERIKIKLKSIIEGDKCKKENLDSWIDYCLKNKKDLFGRSENDISLIPITSIGIENIEEIKKYYSSFFYE